MNCLKKVEIVLGNNNYFIKEKYSLMNINNRWTSIISLPFTLWKKYHSYNL